MNSNIPCLPNFYTLTFAQNLLVRSIVVDEKFKLSQTKSKLYQQTAKFNEAIGAQELNISLGQVKINPDKLTEFILLMRTASKPDKTELINKTLTEWKA